MVAEDFDAESYGGNTFSRILRRCNEFRSKPAAVLTVATMAIFADTVVYGLVVPFLPEILQERLNMSTSANGLLFGCFGIGVLVGAPVSAYISDRWKIRKWPMIFGLLGLGATSALVALSNAYWELVLARLAQGLSSGITWAVGLGMIADVYTGEAMGQAMGVAFSGFTLGYLGGPVLGGAIYSAGGVHAIAIFVAAIAGVDLVFRLLLVEPKDIPSNTVSRAGSIKDSSLGLDEKLLESNRGGIRTSSEKHLFMHAAVSSPALIASPAAVGKAVVIGKSDTRCVTASQNPDEICSVLSRDSEYGISSAKNLDIFAAASASAPALTDRNYADNQANSKSDIMPIKLTKQRRTTMLDLLKEWPILACCLATITITGASGSFEPVLPIHMRDKYNSSTIIISLVFVAIVIPNAFIAPFAGKYTSKKRVLAKVAPYGRFSFMIVGSLVQAILIACIGATTNIAGLVINLVFVGFAGGIAAVPILSTMGEHVERMGGDAYAKVYALFNIAYSIGVIIIPTVLPPIMNAVGFAATMGVVAAILVFGAIVLAIHPTIMLCKHGRSAYVGENSLPFL
ncbi:MFS general substrate transporter [Coemansia reversa NRRL 1564]|uniref:MFS general substrate transporter n=1 Tax=Coemansia reversa (strain ATCC 12441 / NRRL 1564) TaxID=763665 RepID=A0A2G5BI23_COERN|nr:MFS general substrate transporter [Coemansia reversa NRRL 1564]|eukprot:PIA18674.1 MFS general substrate transporter [Coemansia reversa NRRL 1564]